MVYKLYLGWARWLTHVILPTQEFMLVKQVLYLLSHPYSPFYSGYFEDGVS
jgi:hypothetical protein